MQHLPSSCTCSWNGHTHSHTHIHTHLHVVSEKLCELNTCSSPGKWVQCVRSLPRLVYLVLVTLTVGDSRKKKRRSHIYLLTFKFTVTLASTPVRTFAHTHFNCAECVCVSMCVLHLTLFLSVCWWQESYTLHRDRNLPLVHFHLFFWRPKVDPRCQCFSRQQVSFRERNEKNELAAAVLLCVSVSKLVKMSWRKNEEAVLSENVPLESMVISFCLPFC